MNVQGFAQRTAVVAGPCLRSPFFQAGLDYFECQMRDLDRLLGWLLDHPEGLKMAEDVATHAYCRQTSMLSHKQVGRYLLSFLRNQM
jgi:hypothetical protein